MHTIYIAFRFLPLALSFRRDFRRWIFWGRPLKRTTAFHRRRAERMVRTIIALGPTFVKLAQVFAARADLVPEPYVGALGALLDRVPPSPFPAVAAEIEASYGSPHTELFEEFDETPLAAGSLGLVYRARWQGHDVVVKVLRPGIERVIARDLASARQIAAVVERWWPNPHVRGFRITVEEFGRRIDDEMNFRLESEHAIEIGASFTDDPRVIVPHIHAEMARHRVMVMEYVEGERVDRIGHLIETGRVDPAELVRGVMEIYVRMMLMDGLFHADPHPGNLLVAPDGRIVLLDFGMCVRVPVEQRATLVRTVMAAVRKDAAGVADGFEALGIVTPGTDPVEIRRLVQVLLDLAYSGVAPQAAARGLAEEVMRELYDWPIVLTGEMVYFARAAALIEGLGARYVTNFNPIAFASPIVVRMRRHIFATLQMDGGPPVDWPVALGTIAGQAARIIQGAGRELAAVVGTGLAELFARSPLAAAGAPEGVATTGTATPTTVTATALSTVEATVEGAVTSIEAVGGSIFRALGRLLEPPPAEPPPARPPPLRPASPRLLLPPGSSDDVDGERRDVDGRDGGTDDPLAAD
jgi:predicted unusual protein kinase regulating ubiquinone biosynthesis (AarF/ABC1/UbiB family)